MSSVCFKVRGCDCACLCRYQRRPPQPPTATNRPPQQFPLVRHLYHWWGFRPVTKPWIRKLLAQNKVAVLVPGGVQECLFMEHEGAEVVYLR